MYKILTEESDKILIEAGMALLIWTREISPQNTPQVVVEKRNKTDLAPLVFLS